MEPRCEWGKAMNFAGSMSRECRFKVKHHVDRQISFELAFLSASADYGVILDIPNSARDAAEYIRLMSTTNAFCNFFDIVKDARAGKPTSSMVWLRGDEAKKAIKYLDGVVSHKEHYNFKISACASTYSFLGKRHDFGEVESSYRARNNKPPIETVKLYVNGECSRTLSSWSTFLCRPDLRCSDHDCSLASISLRGLFLAGGNAVAHMWEKSELLKTVKGIITNDNAEYISCDWDEKAAGNFNVSLSKH